MERGMGFTPSLDVSWYNRPDMKNIRKLITIGAFILIIGGTAGLLLNEFVWEHSSGFTIIFAIVAFLGLFDLAFAHFVFRDRAGA